MAKMGRPPPAWFKVLDELDLDDDVYLTQREIAEKLGVEIKTVRMTLARYEAESKSEIEDGRAIKRFRLKSLRAMAKKALAAHDKG